jgi:parallel beta-helix repeat protein
MHPRSIAFLALLAAGHALPVQAARSYDNCTGFIDTLPATITTQGTWCLRKDLATAINSGTAITIANNNVVLDCNDFKIGGLAAGLGTATIGVGMGDSPKLNATVRNCAIRGFNLGIVLGGGGNIVEDNRLEANTYTGIYVWGDGSVIQRNIVRDTGGSTYQTGYAYGIYALYSVHVLDNTVSGVTPTQDLGNARGYGIHVSDNADGTISGNRVAGLISFGFGEGGGFGIYTTNSGYISIVGNHVASASGKIGIRCSGWNGEIARDNVVMGFADGINGCRDDSNSLHEVP